MSTNGTRRLTHFLRQPYPFYYQGKDLLAVLLVVFVFGLLFNYLVEPFHVNRDEHRFGYFWISVLHSLVPLIALLVAVGFLTLFLKSTNRDHWNLQKEMGLLVIFLLLTGTGQFLIRDIIYDNPYNWSWGYFFEEIRNTFIVGLILVLILVSLNYNRLNLRHRKWALDAQRTAKKQPGEFPKTPPIFIKTQVKGDDFELVPDALVYAKSDKNYMEIFVRQGETVQKYIKRMTIKDLDAQLAGFPFIFKTHRSYLINLLQVEKVDGNAQGYRLQLADISKELPVSRAMIAGFEQQFSRTLQ